MKILLDTHLILWWQGKRAKLPPQALTLVEAAEGQVYVSRASLWEIVIKVNLGKLNLDLALFCRKIIEDGFLWLPIENAHLLYAATLPLFNDHKDPFDRLLVAQSITEPLILLTVDPQLARYGNTVRVL